jgi:arylsulfatase A-like enzyme
MGSVPSPNLQRFADRALVFENAHATAPLCSPARGSLFTGVSPHRHGILGLSHDRWRYQKNVLTAPERLRPYGYRSILVGLQHENPDPAVLGFDEVLGSGFLPRANQVVDAAITRVDKLEPYGDRDPVFLTIGTWEVHRPWPEEDYQPADPTTVDVPDYLPDNDDTRADIAAFYGSIAQFDAAIGRLLDQLDRTLDPATTMIVFTTDHGAAFPRAKGTLYDAGTGVSFIVRPPVGWGVPAGRSDRMVSHLDVLPTLLDLAGAEATHELEGASLLDELTGTDRIGEDRALVTEKSYHNTFDPIRAIRTRDFAFIRNLADRPRLVLSADLEASRTRKGMGEAHLEPRPAEELYDRRSDPDELRNVVDEPEYADVRVVLSGALATWMDATGDLVPGVDPGRPGPRTRAVDAVDGRPLDETASPTPTVRLTR